jgi:hypothetical protein
MRAGFSPSSVLKRRACVAHANVRGDRVPGAATQTRAESSDWLPDQDQCASVTSTLGPDPFESWRIIGRVLRDNEVHAAARRPSMSDATELEKRLDGELGRTCPCDEILLVLADDVRLFEDRVDGVCRDLEDAVLVAVDDVARSN